jgi:osmotically-inducible protein OsmY
MARVAAPRSRPLLPVDKIKVVVKEGWITLQREVEWNYQRVEAERAARRLKGVRGVANMIVVPPTAPATKIRQKVELVLKRNAGLDASRITVETQGSEVMGSVRSCAQYREVEWTALSAPGVSRVYNQLSVEP